MDTIFKLLNQIIDKKIYDDQFLTKTKDIKDGETWDVYHLKLLKLMLEDYQENLKNAKN